MAKEFLYGETVLYETDEVDEDGRLCLTRMPPEPDEWEIDGVPCLSLRAAAKKAGVHEQWLRERQWSGEVASLRVGSRIYIPLEELPKLGVE